MRRRVNEGYDARMIRNFFSFSSINHWLHSYCYAFKKIIKANSLVSTHIFFYNYTSVKIYISAELLIFLLFNTWWNNMQVKFFLVYLCFKLRRSNWILLIVNLKCANWNLSSLFLIYKIKMVYIRYRGSNMHDIYNNKSGSLFPTGKRGSSKKTIIAENTSIN